MILELRYLLLILILFLQLHFRVSVGLTGTKYLPHVVGPSSLSFEHNPDTNEIDNNLKLHSSLDCKLLFDPWSYIDWIPKLLMNQIAFGVYLIYWKDVISDNNLTNLFNLTRLERDEVKSCSFPHLIAHLTSFIIIGPLKYHFQFIT